MKTIGLVDVFRSQGGLRLKLVKAFDHVIGGLIAKVLPARHEQASELPQGSLSILIIRPGGIGDAVFVLPVLRGLRGQGHKIDALCEQRNAAVFMGQEALCGHVFQYDRLGELNAVLDRKYDVVVDTEQWHHLSAIVSYFIGSRIKIGFSTRPSRARLFDVQVSYDVDAYELINFKRLFTSFDLAGIDQLSGSWVVPEPDIAWAKTIASGPFVTVGLGGSISIRRFTLEQAMSVCDQLIQKGFTPVLLGGKDSEIMAREIVRRHPGVIDMAGRATLSRSAALIAGSKRFIGHDSGLLHIASAVGTPVTAIFGPGNVNKWGPKGIHDRVIHAGLSCSPCTRFGYTIETCSGRHTCVNDIMKGINEKDF